VECEDLDQVAQAVKSGAHIIMLDNMDNLALRKAISLIDHQAKIEVSGNITIGRLATVARLGVDYISSGAITHSAGAKDFSMALERIDE